MKKLLIMLALVSVFTLSAFAQNNSSSNSSKTNRDESCWTNLSYVNIPVLKIMETRDSYLILYQKNKVGTGKTVIPKKWIKGSPEEPRKLKFRNVNTANEAYMSVMKEDNEFLRVVINVPLNKLNPIWGIASSGVPIEGSDKDTLEELEL